MVHTFIGNHPPRGNVDDQDNTQVLESDFNDFQTLPRNFFVAGAEQEQSNTSDDDERTPTRHNEELLKKNADLERHFKDVQKSIDKLKSPRSRQQALDLDSASLNLSITNATDAMMCKVFPTTLKSTAKRWYHKLPRHSIASYSELAILFLNKFASQREIKRTATELMQVHQKEGESLRDYMQWFNKSTLDIDNVPDTICLYALLHGLKPGRFLDDLLENPPKSWNEVNDSHNTEDYQSLKDELEFLARNGKLEGRVNTRSSLIGHTGDAHSIGEGGQSARCRKAYARQVMAVNKNKPLKRPFEEAEWENAPITFNPADYKRLEKEPNVMMPHADPFVATGVRVLKGNQKMARACYQDMFKKVELAAAPKGFSEIHKLTQLGQQTMSILDIEHHPEGVEQKAELVELVEAVPLNPNMPTRTVKEKTTFYAGDAIYCYIMMPFGLKNAGATYQKLVQVVFKLQIDKNIEVYVDDMIVTSKRAEDHINDLNETFQNLRRAQMKLNPLKCTFVVELGKFLGYVVSKKGIELSEYDLKFQPRTTIKGQAMADFLVECLSTIVEEGEERAPIYPIWVLYVDGAANVEGLSAGAVLVGSDGFKFEHALRFKFQTINNAAEYEAFIYGLKLASELKIDKIPRADNQRADELSKLASSQDVNPQRSTIVEEIHEGEYVTHIGGKTLARKLLRHGYYWPTLVEDAQSYVKKCSTCPLNADDIYMPGEMLSSSSLSSPWPFAQWGVNLLGPFVKGKGGCTYLVVVVGYFTKWIEAKPLFTITMKKIEEFLFNSILCRFDIPKRIIADNGPQFQAVTLRSFCNDYGIELTLTSVYTLQSNGQAESANKIVLRGLKTRVLASHSNWVNELNKVLWSCCTTPSSATGETSFSLAYRAEAVIPVEVGLPSDRADQHNDPSNEQLLRENLNLVEEVREMLRIRNMTHQSRVARFYNNRVQARQFQVGDLVLRKARLFLLSNMGPYMGKLALNWEGPYMVICVKQLGSYPLADL
ncbi:hypothetical protein SLEP1_g26542 [Rubroshorea leprosula]|uniref:Integrase catalytic domain-containing protein n=1 Tax=Rubroshorea leprosula TaxID=152421 RepID=A0AAV5JY31_9ROSI|nr:hypothetical protein SLEP1_g26542 [Rubroshorea leprosula]